MLSCVMRIVVDTNVLVGAVMSPEGANREVLRRCLKGTDTLLLGPALFAEFRDVLAREDLFEGSPVSARERSTLFDALCASAEWITSYFLWRPNLPDESDNHIVELAVTGQASWIGSWNVRDLKRGELAFPQVRVGSPIEYLASLNH
ncbi:MAG: PIN domain-containing protein [Steroidobacteraceae bacterium]